MPCLLLVVRRPPALDTLADQPELAVSGPVAWAAWSRDRLCLRVADVGGRVHDVRCGGVARPDRVDPPDTASIVTRVERGGDTLIVRLETATGTNTILWRTDADTSYDVRASSLSPDGDWVVLVDGATAAGRPCGRLHGATRRGHGRETWQAPVWEGAVPN